MFNETKNLARRVRGRFSATLVLACSLALAASAQSVKAPAVPIDIRVPEGNSAFLIAHAFGSQGYTCLPTANGGTAWGATARPEATLFVNVLGQLVQVITHFASVNANPNDFAVKPVPLGGNATWQSVFDSSKVWAVATGHIDAGTDDSCSHAGSIPCLRLQSVGNQAGPNGGQILAKTTFVQRLNTAGGAAPTTTCTVGQTQLQPYTADYVFFHKD